MEELVWKYIDNDCTDDELSQVNHLLANDEAFIMMYEDIVQLNALLLSQANKPISAQFKAKLSKNIQNHLALKAFGKTDVLPLPWIVSLIVIALLVIIYAVYSPDEGTSLFNFHFSMEEKTISLSIWSMMAFLCLVATDALLKRMHLFKKQKLFFV